MNMRSDQLGVHGDQLEVEVRVGDRAVDVRVVGEIDIATVAQFRSVLWSQPPRPVLRLDLSGVPLFSAAAIRTLVAAHLGVRARGGQLVLVDPHPMILRVLRGTNLHRVIPVLTSTGRVTLPSGRPPADSVWPGQPPAVTDAGVRVPRQPWAVTDVSRTRTSVDRRPADLVVRVPGAARPLAVA